MISLLLNSREKGRQNLGNIFEWVDSVRHSISSLDLVEMIIKYDMDDGDSFLVMAELKAKNPDLRIKTIHSVREGYSGQHIGHQQCFRYLNPKSLVVCPTADDIFFVKGTNWDIPILAHAQKYPDGIFLAKMAPALDYTDLIIFSRKLIELVGFGPTFGVDQWGYSICKLLVELNLQDRILHSTESAHRRGCNLDFLGASPEADARWHGDRQTMLDFVGSSKYQELLNQVRDTIVNYMKL